MRLRNVLAGLIVTAFVTSAAPVAAQTRQLPPKPDYQPIAATDIQRLQDAVYDISHDISRVRERDPQAADQMQGQLDTLRDEATYLKVKLRKDGSVSRDEYSDVRDRLDALRSRARDVASGTGSYPTAQGTSGSPSSNRSSGYPDQPPSNRSDSSGSPRASSSANPNEVPTGTELDVKLQQQLSSSTAQVEDRFRGTSLVDLSNSDGRVLIPAGSTLRGVVSSVNKATRTDRKGSLTLAFDQVTINGRSYPIHATVTQALESEGIRGEVGKIGAGAGVGAIIGGILGGVKGALAGILIGGGGTVLATTGKDVDLPQGTVLRVAFDSPLVVR